MSPNLHCHRCSRPGMWARFLSRIDLGNRRSSGYRLAGRPFSTQSWLPNPRTWRTINPGQSRVKGSAQIKGLLPKEKRIILRVAAACLEWFGKQRRQDDEHGKCQTGVLALVISDTPSVAICASSGAPHEMAQTPGMERPRLKIWWVGIRSVIDGRQPRDAHLPSRECPTTLRGW